ncbi:MAG: hypothetical protein U0Q11_01630 [Vicinamibacterales bacterium]
MRGRGRGIVAAAVVVAAALSVGASAGAQTLTFEQTVADLTNSDVDARLRAAQALKESPFPEAALPLAKAVLDTDDRVQHEAISAELNVFLAERIVPRKRVGFVIEVRNRIDPQSIFEAGWRALDPRVVPDAVLTALRTAANDDNSTIAAEALYAFGSLGANVYGRDRDALLTRSASELATTLGNPDYRVREAAVQVVERLYWRRPGEGAIDMTLGDALVTTLNDRAPSVRRGAMNALGAARYERSVQALTDMVLHYEHGPDAVAGMFALARIAHASSAALFNQALVGRDALLKAAAIEGIARSGDVAEAGRLAQAAAGDKNGEVQLSASFADAVLSEGSINALVDGLTKPALHNRALGLMSEVAPGRESTLAPHVPDPKPAVRADLLDAIGISNDQGLLTQVERLVNDPDPVVARTATRAMFRLKGQGAPGTRP